MRSRSLRLDRDRIGYEYPIGGRITNQYGRDRCALMATVLVVVVTTNASPSVVWGPITTDALAINWAMIADGIGSVCSAQKAMLFLYSVAFDALP